MDLKWGCLVPVGCKTRFRREHGSRKPSEHCSRRRLTGFLRAQATCESRQVRRPWTVFLCVATSGRVRAGRRPAPSLPTGAKPPQSARRRHEPGRGAILGEIIDRGRPPGRWATASGDLWRLRAARSRVAAAARDRNGFVLTAQRRTSVADAQRPGNRRGRANACALPAPTDASTTFRPHRWLQFRMRLRCRRCCAGPCSPRGRATGRSLGAGAEDRPRTNLS